MMRALECSQWGEHPLVKQAADNGWQSREVEYEVVRYDTLAGVSLFWDQDDTALYS